MKSSFSRSRLGVIKPHQETAVGLVLGRVHDRDLVAERKLVAVLIDQVAHVVADEGDGKAGKRTGDRVARREGRRVGEHRDRFFVARHHHHVVVRLLLDRALDAQVVEVGVRVDDQLVAPEEIDGVELPHGPSFPSAIERFAAENLVLRTRE